VDATRDLLANLLASAISVEYGEGVCAGGRDRYRTCDLCRVNESRRSHPASRRLQPHYQTLGQRRGIAVARDASRGLMRPGC